MRDNIIDSSKGVNAMSQRKEISYSGYLELDKILQAQQPLSSAHDEMLFIIQHQTSELWMKLAIHELSATCRLIAANDLSRPSRHCRGYPASLSSSTRPGMCFAP